MSTSSSSLLLASVVVVVVEEEEAGGLYVSMRVQVCVHQQVTQVRLWIHRLFQRIAHASKSINSTTHPQ